MYRAIIFDVDDTIVQSSCKTLRSLCRLLREEKGLDRRPEELAHLMGGTSCTILAPFYPEEEVPEAVDRWRRLLAEDTSPVPAYPGMDKVLRTLSERGARLGIVTSRTRAEMDMNAIGPYLPLFQAVVSADMVSHPKPHPEPLETCLSLLGVPREETLYVGESLPDQGCSAGAGVDFALGLWGTRHPEMEATYKLSCPEELLELTGCPCDQFIRGR